MKKIMSLFLVLVTLLLVACDRDDFVSSQPEETNTNVAVLEVEFDGNIEKVEIKVDEDVEQALFDALNSHFTISYDTFDFGRMLNSIQSKKNQQLKIIPSYGSFIGIYINGETASVGIDDIIIENDNTYRFALEWWDPVAKQIYDSIQSFIENYAHKYVNGETIEYHTVAALAHLGILNDYLTLRDVEKYYNISEDSNSGVLYQAILVLSALGNDPTKFNGENLIERLIELNDTAQYAAPNALIALNAYSHGVDISDYETELLNVLKTVSKPTKLNGLDLSGMTLAALAPYTEDEVVKTIIDNYIEFLAENLSERGGIRDEHWDTPENAASLAQLIIGLVAHGIDPRSETLNQEQGNLMTRLLEFANGDGSFNYTLDANKPDLAFSTPQAFLALVVYQQFLETSSPVPYYQFHSTN